MSTDRSRQQACCVRWGTNNTEVLINRTLLQLSRMWMHGASAADFEVRVGEVLPTFRVGNPTAGGAPVEISNGELVVVWGLLSHGSCWYWTESRVWLSETLWGLSIVNSINQHTRRPFCSSNQKTVSQQNNKWGFLLPNVHLWMKKFIITYLSWDIPSAFVIKTFKDKSLCNHWFSFFWVFWIIRVKFKEHRFLVFRNREPLICNFFPYRCNPVKSMK